jgi:hypothetical protein
MIWEGFSGSWFKMKDSTFFFIINILSMIIGIEIFGIFQKAILEQDYYLLIVFGIVSILWLFGLIKMTLDLKRDEDIKS